MSLSRNPQPIDEQTWYYEEAKGLAVIREVRDPDGKWKRTDRFLTPIIRVMP